MMVLAGLSTLGEEENYLIYDHLEASIHFCLTLCLSKGGVEIVFHLIMILTIQALT